MPITILGSYREKYREEDTARYRLKGSPEEFAKACEAIGGQLARNEQEVIVASDKEHTADYHIVKGIVEAAAETGLLRPCIHIIRPREGDLFWDFRRQYGNLFIQDAAGTRHSSEGATIIAVRDADAVLTIGGGSRTYRVGLASIVARKNLVPIGSFGGASLELLDDVVKYGHDTSGNVTTTFGSLSGPWSSNVLNHALSLAGVTKPATAPTILIIHGHSSDHEKLRYWSETQGVLPHANLPTLGETWRGGLTLAELFEQHAAQVDGAIAIATPDDVGGLKEEDPSAYRQRARQNVWLEVGWFWGRLGRNRVMILCKGDIELPTDLDGIKSPRYTTSLEQEVGDEIRKFISQIQRGA